jgi:acyl carrier protein
MNEKLFNEVRLFTAGFQGLLESDIEQNSSIQDDLGIWGDDAIEFVLAFAKEFNVDVSKFMAADYFTGEGEFILSSKRTSKFKDPTRKDLTISHLVKAAEAGRLDEEVIHFS